MNVNTVSVNKYRLYPNSTFVGTQYSYGIEQLQFTFDSTWDGLTKQITFYPTGLTEEFANIDDTGIVDVPYDVTQIKGTCPYVVSGYTNGQQIVSVIGSLIVNITNDPGNTPVPPTPTQYIYVKTYATYIQGLRENNGIFEYTTDGVTWKSIQVTSTVYSVNGKVGNVVLTASDVNALPDNTIYVETVDGQNGVVVLNDVKYTEQTLTTTQQTQVRKNIGAAPVAGSYELIETITLTEDTTSVVRTREPDGTPYAFKAIGVVVQAEVGSVNCGINVIGNYKSTRLQAGFIYGAINDSTKKYGYAQIYPDWGAWTAIGSTAVNGFGWTVTQMTGYSPAQAFSVKESENPYCTQVVVQVNMSNETIPAGTVISVYGVRA